MPVLMTNLIVVVVVGGGGKQKLHKKSLMQVDSFPPSRNY
jgi:hypothetical protein